MVENEAKNVINNRMLCKYEDFEFFKLKMKKNPVQNGILFTRKRMEKRGITILQL
jgi:hypothetical protein